MSNHSIRFPAEWETQSGVLICWPHRNTDWVDLLDEVNTMYLSLAQTISRFEKLLILTANQTHIAEIKQLLSSASVDLSQIIFHSTQTNDTWTRDYGPITVQQNGQNRILDFVFNGWGNKFNATLDNAITEKLVKNNVLKTDLFESMDFVLEGGSIESDGKGTLLTTSDCLLTKTRNPQFSKAQVEVFLKNKLGINKILWLEHGYLAGDDTDSHIDMIARFTDVHTIAYVKCDDPSDEHFQAMSNLENQLKSFRNYNNQPYTLRVLPFASPVYDEESGRRLPASYANFLIINNAVLVPIYDDEEKDQQALNVLSQCFPDREIIGIPFRTAIKQNGSLHCLTMQLPQGLI